MEPKIIKDNEDLMRKSIEKQDILNKESDNKTPNSIANANNIRGIFMNEHVSKEEQLKSQEKKRKMKEFLELKLKY